MADDKDIHYAREAFLLPQNLAFLATTLVLAVVLGGVGFVPSVILLLAAAAELMFLGYAPRNERFQRLVRSQKAAEKNRAETQREVFNQLGRQSQRRYARLRQIEKEIQANYKRLQTTSQGLVQTHLRKLDSLLTSYLNLLLARERYDEAMQASSRSEITAAIAALKADMADDPPRVYAIKERRLKILQNRLDRLFKGAENVEIIEAQLATIEDVTKYVHEQSLTLRNPEDVTLQLDTLLHEVENTEATVQQVEDMLSGNFPMLDLDALGDAPDELRSEMRESSGTRTPEQTSGGRIQP